MPSESSARIKLTAFQNTPGDSSSTTYSPILILIPSMVAPAGIPEKSKLLAARPLDRLFVVPSKMTLALFSSSALQLSGLLQSISPPLTARLPTIVPGNFQPVLAIMESPSDYHG